MTTILTSAQPVGTSWGGVDATRTGWRPLWTLVIAILLIVPAGHAAWAQSAELRQLSNEYRTQFKAGDAEKAAETAARAAEMAEHELGEAHRFTAAQYLNLASILRQLEEDEATRAAYRQGLGILAAALGAEAPELAAARRDFAGYLGRRGDYQGAVDMLETAAKDAAALPREHPEAIAIAADLAQYYRRLDRLELAEPLYERVLNAYQRRYGPRHPRVAGAMNNLALLKRRQGRLSEAEQLLVRAVDILEETRGRAHPSTATALDSLGGVRLAQGKYKDAAADLKAALDGFRALYPQDHPRLAQSLNNMAVALLRFGKPRDAERFAVEHFEMVERIYGLEHPETATAHLTLGAVYDQLARFDEAEGAYREAVDIREALLGPNHPRTIAALNNLAELYKQQARYADAEALLLEAVIRTDETYDYDHPEQATALHNLGNLLRLLGRDENAEAAVTDALRIRERLLGTRHPETADSMEALGALRQAQGRYGEAEPYFIRAVEIREAVLGPEHPDLANGLRNLATLLALGGRVRDARGLLARAQSIYEQALGPRHPAVAGVLAALAEFDRRLNQATLAVASLQAALDIRIEAFDALHPEVALTMMELGGAYLAQGETDKAARQFETALAIIRAAFGERHRRTAQALNNLAGAMGDTGDLATAEAHYRDALEIQSKALGTNHPDLAVTLGNLAALHRRQGYEERALDAIRQATVILQDRFIGPAATVLEARDGERKSRRDTFLFHTDLALAAAAEDVGARPQLIAEAFHAAQLAQSSKAARAIARTAARFSAAGDDLAELVRQRQDLATYLSRLEDAFIQAMNAADGRIPLDARDRLRAEVFATKRRLIGVDQSLSQRYPRYQELTNPPPLSLDQAQRLLRPGEGMIVLTLDSAKSYVWALTRDDFSAHVVAIGAEDVGDIVAELRDGVDLSASSSLQHLPRFDTPLAHELYARLLAPAMATLTGAKHVFVVPDGALGGLPIGLLVTRPQSAPPQDAEGYRRVPWLGTQAAMTVLPTVPSLRAVRMFQASAAGKRPFLGIGDPVLEGGGQGQRGVLRGIYRDGGRLADVSKVRQLARLPETREELTTIAASLGADADAVLLGPEATETRLRAVDLSAYRLISFATHGLVAGELQGLPEPALVLTPPEKATERDDGLLTASEIAALSLNAELVILSACNTAAGDRPDGEGFSGLASAFIYAGGRALLASHWPVASDAAQQLTQSMFENGGAQGATGAAERLRQAMIRLMQDPERPEFAHPAFWAPFVVIGEGGAG